MKRKVLWVSSLAVWFLIFSTFFSLRVERWMTPIVTECVPTSSQSSTGARLSLDCLFPDEEGLPVLYQTYEGLGWDAGLRVKQASPLYTVMEDSIAAGGVDRVVQYASKEFTAGERVTVTDLKATREDLYLAVCPTGVRLREDLPENIEVLAQTENALLARAGQAPQIFMPKQATGELFQRYPFTMPDERVYSLADVDSFFSALPLAALLPGMMVFVLLLWGGSFSFLKDVKNNRVRLLLNGCFMAATLLVLPLLLHFLQFPSSLLPKSSIVEGSHYMREFTEILSSLSHFAAAGVTEAQASLSHAHTMLWVSLGVILLPALLAAAVLVLERRGPRTTAA